MLGAIATGLYFISGAMPYLDLKSAQSTDIFANLRLEAGVRNHLVFPNLSGPLKYLADIPELVVSHELKGAACTAGEERADCPSFDLRA